MNFLIETLSQIRDTDYKKYLAILDDLELKFTDCGDADALAFIQGLKAVEKYGKIAF